MEIKKKIKITDAHGYIRYDYTPYEPSVFVRVDEEFANRKFHKKRIYYDIPYVYTFECDEK